jgi:hypothetical protein
MEPGRRCQECRGGHGATEGEPSMRLVESVIVGCVLEKIDAAIDAAREE